MLLERDPTETNAFIEPLLLPALLRLLSDESDDVVILNLQVWGRERFNVMYYYFVK